MSNWDEPSFFFDCKPDTHFDSYRRMNAGVPVHLPFQLQVSGDIIFIYSSNPPPPPPTHTHTHPCIYTPHHHHYPTSSQHTSLAIVLDSIYFSPTSSNLTPDLTCMLQTHTVRLTLTPAEAENAGVLVRLPLPK